MNNQHQQGDALAALKVMDHKKLDLQLSCPTVAALGFKEAVLGKGAVGVAQCWGASPT